MTHVGRFALDPETARQTVQDDLGVPQHQVEQDVFGRVLSRDERGTLNRLINQRGGPTGLRDILKRATDQPLPVGHPARGQEQSPAVARRIIQQWAPEFFDESKQLQTVRTTGPGVNEGTVEVQVSDRPQQQQTPTGKAVTQTGEAQQAAGGGGLVGVVLLVTIVFLALREVLG